MANHLTKQFLVQQEKNLQSEKIKILEQIAKMKLDDPFSDPDHAIDNAAVDTDVREQESHLILEAETKQLERRLEDIEIALNKIVKGTYGYCEKSNKLIPKERLELIPEARFIVE